MLRISAGVQPVDGAGLKISVIIPAHNAEKYLKRAVLSLVDTQYPKLEIIVVDDGSTDSTWEVAQTLSNEFSLVRIFQHPDGGNHGVSVARNLGLERCTGELIGFLDADDYVLPHRFTIAVALLESNPEIDAVHELAQMEFEGDRDSEIFWDRDEMFGIRALRNTRCSFRELLGGVCWNPGCILFRRAFLSKSGKFPAQYRFAEDYHLWLRMVCIGNVVSGCDAGPVSIYYRHPKNTFHGELARKNDVIRAMTSVYGWLNDNPHSQVDRTEFAKLVCVYILNAFIQVREKRRCDIGRRIARTLILNKFVPALGDHELLRQLIWVLIGRIAPKQNPGFEGR